MVKTKTIPVCKYGSKCYRKNRQHFEEFSHQEPEEDDVSSEEDEPQTKRKKTDAEATASSKGASKDVVSEDETSTTAEGEESVPATSTEDTIDETAEEEEEESQPPASPADVKENIKAKFLVEMPDDFYEFWDLAKKVKPKDPCNAFRASLGLQLVGPFDILAGNNKAKNASGKRPCYLRHWRYYYDPPEFQTIIRGDDAAQFHVGYFRDDPKEMPAFVASNAAKENCSITARGENLFAAVNWFIDDLCKKDKSNKEKLSKLKEQIVDEANSCERSLELKTKGMKARDKKVVCKSFHGAGIVVPVNEQGIGYREVPETPSDLKKMFKNIAKCKDDKERDVNSDPLMELIMLVQFANDECDYGEGLELGMDLFCYGGECFHNHIKNLMPLAYQLLGRPEYSQILLAHLEERKHTPQLSQLD